MGDEKAPNEKRAAILVPLLERRKVVLETRERVIPVCPIHPQPAGKKKATIGKIE
jgi:hypothetical protein